MQSHHSHGCNIQRKCEAPIGEEYHGSDSWWLPSPQRRVFKEEDIECVDDSACWSKIVEQSYRAHLALATQQNLLQSVFVRLKNNCCSLDQEACENESKFTNWRNSDTQNNHANRQQNSEGRLGIADSHTPTCKQGCDWANCLCHQVFQIIPQSALGGSCLPWAFVWKTCWGTGRPHSTVSDSYWSTSQ